MESERCPSCRATTIIMGAMNGQRWAPATIFNPGYSRYAVLGTDGVPKLGGPTFCCCMSCGLIWSSVDPRQLREYVAAQGDMLTKQDAGMLPRAPLIDLSVSSPGASDALRQVEQIDALVRTDDLRGAEAMLRELIGGPRRSWSGALYSWRKLTREEKLALLGWRLKRLGKEDESEMVVHPLLDRELDS